MGRKIYKRSNGIKFMEKRIVVVSLVLTLFLIASCTTSTPVGKEEFKALCEQNNHRWMDMKPMLNGQILEDKDSCWGCMPDGENHICEQGQYMKFIGGK